MMRLKPAAAAESTRDSIAFGEDSRAAFLSKSTRSEGPGAGGGGDRTYFAESPGADSPALESPLAGLEGACAAAGRVVDANPKLKSRTKVTAIGTRLAGPILDLADDVLVLGEFSGRQFR